MAVQAASLEVLEKAAVPPAQARAIVQAIEIEIAGASNTLATKQDTLSVRHEVSAMGAGLRHEMAEIRAQLQHEMAEMRTELRHEIAEMGAELRREMTEMGAELRREITEMGTELHREMGQMRAEFHAAMTSNVRHMYGAILGQFALLLGLAYFLVGHLQR